MVNFSGTPRSTSGVASRRVRRSNSTRCSLRVREYSVATDRESVLSQEEKSDSTRQICLMLGPERVAMEETPTPSAGAEASFDGAAAPDEPFLASSCSCCCVVACLNPHAAPTSTFSSSQSRLPQQLSL